MRLAFAQAQGAETPIGPNPFATIVPLLLVFVVFYFLLIRPQRKKERALKERLSALKTGDQILTSGGLYGTIIGFGEDNRVKVQIAENVKVEIAKTAISEKVTKAIEGEKGKGA